MITEDYVSLETAKLLKDKGFRCATNRYYNAQYDEIRTTSDTFMMNWNDAKYMKHLGMEGAVAIPTLQMAAKWLREEHNLSIDNTCSIRGFYCSVVRIVKDKSGRIIDVEDSADWETSYCKTFEEAFDKALKFCLERMLD